MNVKILGLGVVLLSVQACSSQNDASSLLVTPEGTSAQSEQERTKLEEERRAILIKALEKLPPITSDQTGNRSENGVEIDTATKQLLSDLKNKSLSSMIHFELAELDLGEGATAEDYQEAASKLKRNVLRVTLVARDGTSLKVKSYQVEFESDIKDLRSEAEVTSAKLKGVKRLDETTGVAT